jgi:hypothetical protein
MILENIALIINLFNIIIHSRDYKTFETIHVSAFLIMKNRLTDRIRHSNASLEFLSTERSGRLKRGLSLEVSSTIYDDVIDHLQNSQLREAIHEIE